MVPQASYTTPGNNIFDRAYEILEAVGRGRNSVVYRAKKLTPHFKHDEIVALKVLLGTPKQRFSNLKRMRREALAMLACRHQNVVRLNDYVATSDLCYLSMEYCAGGDLRMLLEQRPSAIPTYQALEIILQVLRGLEAIHRAGVIHRDIKPENLLICADTTVKIADFGVAVLPLRELSSSDLGLGVGTFDYLSPETLRDGVADERSDLYSVGVTLFQLLTNHLPFEGRSITEQIDQKMHGLSVELATMVTEPAPFLDDLLRRALANSPEQRFQTAAEFREALERFVTGQWRPATEDVLRGEIEARRERLELPAGVERPEEPLLREHAVPESAYEHTTEHPEVYEQDYEPTGEHSGESFGEQDTDYADARGVEVERLQSYAREMGSDLGEAPARSSAVRRVLIPLALSAIALLVCFGPLNHQLTDLAAYFLGDAKNQEISRIQPADAPLVTQEEKRAMLASTSGGPLAVLSSERAGVIEHLFADGSDVPLVTKPLGENKFLITLGLYGWQSVEVDGAQVSQDKELLISGAGIKLLLHFDDLAVADGKVLSGSYKELISGREGQWGVW